MTNQTKDVEITEGKDYAQKSAITITDATDIPAIATPAVLLHMAVEQGRDLDYVEKLMDMQDRWEDKQAEKAFNQAMADFSANLPTIEKTVYVEHFDGYHADLGLMAKAIREAMAPHGLSFAWKTTQGDLITVACVIKHRGGHSESVTLSAAPDTSGSKNSIQAIGSAVKYLERYTLESATGIVASGADDDGRGAVREPDLITDEQAGEITKFIDSHNMNENSILVYIKSKTGEASYKSIKAVDYDNVMNILRTKVQKREPGEDG